MITTPAHSAALAVELLRHWFPGPLEVDPDRLDELPPLHLPALTDGQSREARRWLRERSASPLERAEALALLRHAHRLSELVSLEYHRKLLLELTGRMSLPAVGDLARGWPAPMSEALAARRTGEVEELELFAEEFGCLGETLSPWVEEARIDAAAGGDASLRRRYLNAMRWLRMHEVVANCWVAETMFPRVVKPPTGAALVWTVGAPVVVEQLEAVAEVDILITASDERAKSARQRRELAADRVRGLLRQGLRVGMVANHSTLESREHLLEVARELGAASIAVFFDLSEEAIEQRNAEAGWPAPRRSVERVLEMLEAPRPHEAEEVLVVGDEGLTARWQLGQNVQDGFREEPPG